MEAQSRLLCFILGGQFCALPAESVSEILPMAWLSRPPGLPSILKGFLNLRGSAVPVLRTARLFGLPEPSLGPYTPLLIARGRSHPLGLLVEAATSMASVPGPLLPVPEDCLFNECAEGITPGEEPVCVLCLERLLLAEERRRILELQALEQERLEALIKETPATLRGLSGEKEPFHQETPATLRELSGEKEPFIEEGP